MLFTSPNIESMSRRWEECMPPTPARRRRVILAGGAHRRWANATPSLQIDVVRARSVVIVVTTFWCASKNNTLGSAATELRRAAAT